MIAYLRRRSEYTFQFWPMLGNANDLYYLETHKQHLGDTEWNSPWFWLSRWSTREAAHIGPLTFAMLVSICLKDDAIGIVSCVRSTAQLRIPLKQPRWIDKTGQRYHLTTPNRSTTGQLIAVCDRLFKTPYATAAWTVTSRKHVCRASMSRTARIPGLRWQILIKTGNSLGIQQGNGSFLWTSLLLLLHVIVMLRCTTPWMHKNGIVQTLTAHFLILMFYNKFAILCCHMRLTKFNTSKATKTTLRLLSRTGNLY
jgi:hypothetical protein